MVGQLNWRMEPTVGGLISLCSWQSDIFIEEIIPDQLWKEVHLGDDLRGTHRSNMLCECDSTEMLQRVRLPCMEKKSQCNINQIV